MSEFGQPARNATTDANAGVVNSPAVRTVARTGQTTNVRAASSLESGLDALGDSLGNALTGMLTKEKENINAQRELDASIRQGEEKAVNAIDETKKRTGWEEAVFGQNVEYRAAQQRAVENNVRQMYLEQANSISEYAAETPDQYSARLKSQLDAQLKEFENDTETQKLITANWAKASEKLTQHQSKEHYAYNQTQQRETTSLQVRGILDVFTTESKLVSTQAEAQEMVGAANSLFSMQGKPAGMTDMAYRSVINEELVLQLKAGNIGAYNMAKDNGWLDKQPTGVAKQFETAINQYDVKTANKISLTVSQAKLGAQKVGTIEELGALVAEASAQLDNHEQRTSGTDKYANNITKARIALNDLVANGMRGVSEKQAKLDRTNAIIEAQNVAVTGDGTKLAGLGHVTKKEHQEASAQRFVTQVGDYTGTEDLSFEDATRAILADPNGAGSQVVDVWKDDAFDAGFLKSISQSYINGFGNPAMTDENGQPTEQARLTMQLMAQFETADRAKFRKQIGEDSYDEYMMIKDGQLAGKTPEMITRDVDAMREARGNVDYWAADWDLPKDTSKREYITGIVTDSIGQVPTGTSVGKYMEVYNRGLKLGKGDKETARNYLRDYVQNTGTAYRGQIIHNGEQLAETFQEYTLGDVLDGMQSSDVNLMTGLFTIAMGKTEDAEGNPIRTLDELDGNVTFEVSHDGGLWMRSRKFQQDILITPEYLKTAEQKMIQNENQRKLEAQIEKENAEAQKAKELQLFDSINLKSF